MIAAVALIQDSTDTVAEDVAEREFARWCRSMRLDFDHDRMSQDDREAFENEKRTIVRAIRSGRLSINDAGEAVFRPEEGEPITFYRPRGEMLTAMDQRKKDHNMEKLYAAIAVMTKEPPVRFNTMVLSDVKIPIALANLFFGSR